MAENVDIITQLRRYCRVGLIQPKLIRVCMSAIDEINTLREENKNLKEKVE